MAAADDDLTTHARAPDPLCQCGHGKSVHTIEPWNRVAGCAACQAWEENDRGEANPLACTGFAE